MFCFDQVKLGRYFPEGTSFGDRKGVTEAGGVVVSDDVRLILNVQFAEVVEETATA
ncbi:MAG: hypothetical protein ACI9V1_000473 [Spirosomataceae bacterium]|jgi:hypothetical protein